MDFGHASFQGFEKKTPKPWGGTSCMLVCCAKEKSTIIKSNY